MANRKQHIAGATAFWLVLFLLYYFVGGMFIDISLQQNAMWIMLSLLMAQMGAQMPDYDVIWQRAFPHRNILTHSLILPGLISIVIVWINDESVILLPLFSMFLIGYSSHLLMDLIFTEKSWKGTARIKVFYWKEEKFKSMTKFWSKVWLFVNGLLLFVAGCATMLTYQLW